MRQGAVRPLLGTNDARPYRPALTNMKGQAFLAADTSCRLAVTDVPETTCGSPITDCGLPLCLSFSLFAFRFRFSLFAFSLFRFFAFSLFAFRFFAFSLSLFAFSLSRLANCGLWVAVMSVLFAFAFSLFPVLFATFSLFAQPPRAGVRLLEWWREWLTEPRANAQRLIGDGDDWRSQSRPDLNYSPRANLARRRTQRYNVMGKER